MALFDFSMLRKSVQTLSSQVKDMRQQIEKLQREREDIVNAPATREDVKAMVCAWAAGRRKEYAQRLRANIEFFVRKADRISDPASVSQRMTLHGVTHMVNGLVPGPALNDMALCALLGEQLDKAVCAVIDGMDWPAGALPLAGRAQRLERIDAELTKLTKQEEEVVTSARQAGVLFE